MTKRLVLAIVIFTGMHFSCLTVMFSGFDKVRIDLAEMSDHVAAFKEFAFTGDGNFGGCFGSGYPAEEVSDVWFEVGVDKDGKKDGWQLFTKKQIGVAIGPHQGVTIYYRGNNITFTNPTVEGKGNGKTLKLALNFEYSFIRRTGNLQFNVVGVEEVKEEGGKGADLEEANVSGFSLGSSIGPSGSTFSVGSQSCDLPRTNSKGNIGDDGGDGEKPEGLE